jgi:hypothetical protein
MRTVQIPLPPGYFGAYLQYWCGWRGTIKRYRTRSAAKGSASDCALMHQNKLTAATLADKIKDLDASRNAIIDASNLGTGLWLSFVFLLFYFAITAGGVTHFDLLSEKPPKLPFLSVDLPLVGFFYLAPLLFLIVHAYVLLHIAMLASKVGDFNHQLQDPQLKRPALATEALRRQLPNNIFVQSLAGPSDIRTSVMGFMLRLVARISLVICPVALLVLFQLQFLPFHRWDVTWWHRVAVVFDIALLWALWPSIERGAITRIRLRDLRQRRVAATASLAPVLLVFTLATYPGEWLDATPSVLFLPTKWPGSNSEVAVPITTWAQGACTFDYENNAEKTEGENKEDSAILSP